MPTKLKIESLDVIDFRINTFIPENNKSKASVELPIGESKIMITEVDFDKLQENLAKSNTKRYNEVENQQKQRRSVGRKASSD